jgi:pyridoxal phosphate enzyme (YggS family)
VAPSVRENLKEVRDRVAQAAAKAGTAPDAIRVVAVTKTLGQDAVNEAVSAGATDIGENYVQEAAEKIKGFTGAARPTWHMIGHLQTNKAKAAVELFDLIQTVDSVRLAREMAKHALKIGKVQDVLVEVHVTGESAKFGADPEDLTPLVDGILDLEGVRLRGIMGMAPFVSDPEETRPYFLELKAAFDRLPPENREILSMGMTQDYEVAVEEGSNMVRIGTAIFGPRG